MKKLWTFLNHVGLSIVWTLITIFFAYQWFMPVLGFVSASSWQASPGRVGALIQGWKLRDCRFVSDSELAYAKSGDTWRRINFRIDPGSVSRKDGGLGPHKLGFWVWIENPPGAPIDEVLARVLYLCGSNLTPVDIGPFRVPHEG